MTLLSRDLEFNEPTWLDTSFPALVVDNFISSCECEDLVKDGRTYILSKPAGLDIIHGGRTFMPWSSYDFQELRRESVVWDDLSQSLAADGLSIWSRALRSCNKDYRDSLTDCFKHTHLTDLELLRFSSRFLTERHLSKYKEILESKVKNTSVASIFGAMGVRLIDSIYRVILSRLISLRSTPLIPLFDYSFSNKGYSRNIHRDSDCRMLVLLLYLNDLDESHEGGDLELYDYSTDGDAINPKVRYPAWPGKEYCNLRYKIQPRRGRLILFYNQFNSYHAVSTMKGLGQGRHFIYGGFTLPSSILSKSNRLRGSDISKTEFHLY